MYQAGKFRQDKDPIGRIFLRKNGSGRDKGKTSGIGKEKDDLNIPKQQK